MSNTTTTTAIINALRTAQEQAEVAKAFKTIYGDNEYTNDDVIGRSIDVASWETFRVSSSYELTDEELIITLNISEDDTSQDFYESKALFISNTIDLCDGDTFSEEDAELLAKADNEAWADGDREAFMSGSFVLGDGQREIIKALVEELGGVFSEDAVANAVRFDELFLANEPFDADDYLTAWEERNAA